MFNKALTFTLKYEGGYVNHPNDPGGETNRGVTRLVYDSYRRSKGLPMQSVKLITDHEVTDIYKSRYWAEGYCDAMPEPVAIVMFDTAVNTGVKRAAVLLQRALRIVDDGVIGPKTLAAIKTVDAHELAILFIDERDKFYKALVANKASFAVFLKGWLNRTKALREIV